MTHEIAEHGSGEQFIAAVPGQDHPPGRKQCPVLPEFAEVTGTVHGLRCWAPVRERYGDIRGYEVDVDTEMLSGNGRVTAFVIGDEVLVDRTDTAQACPVALGCSCQHRCGDGGGIQSAAHEDGRLSPPHPVGGGRVQQFPKMRAIVFGALATQRFRQRELPVAFDAEFSLLENQDMRRGKTSDVFVDGNFRIGNESESKKLRDSLVVQIVRDVGVQPDDVRRTGGDQLVLFMTVK